MARFSSSLFVSAINHVLTNETWGRAKLLPFAGQTAQIDASLLQISVSITASGLFETAPNVDHQPSVIISIPVDTLVKLISGDNSAIFAAARISGSAEFAEALAFVFRNLEWDSESDLAGLIGDIPANRVMSALKTLLNWQNSAVMNTAQIFKEYVTEESHQIISRREIDAFGQAVNTLRDDLDRLNKRLSRL